MKGKKVIHRTDLPVRLPINSTILYTFLLYYFNVQPFIWGVFITIFTLYWILCIIGLVIQDQKKIFIEPSSKKIESKSEWFRRLEETLNQQSK